MRIPERPALLSELDLMHRLKQYADGDASYDPSERNLGSRERGACLQLYTNLTALVEKCLHPLMDRITSREMRGFTMHDHAHGLKVAHLMWHILKPARRERLTPGEIAILVVAAHLHDLGMGLSDEERQARLRADSDLWETIESQSTLTDALAGLVELAKQEDAPEAAKSEAAFQVQQAQEALLCADTRERHATETRYKEIIRGLESMHLADPTKIPDVSAALSFDGDSYAEKLIEVCVSHNQDAHVLTDRDPANADQWRFPTRYPIGCCLADIRLLAATLRLADILDFDRERTPAVLFHYLLPRSATPSENVSVREWSKHLSISNWEAEQEKIVFRGRSPSAFVHHTIVEFCRTIEEEITRTYSLFDVDDWPFCVASRVEANIETHGYRYIPYRFSLDEEKIYQLLMGDNIYSNPLVSGRKVVESGESVVIHCRAPELQPGGARCGRWKIAVLTTAAAFGIRAI